jgi:phosphoribosylanthranilate isomerase
VATWVKICGVTRLEDARAAVDAGADAIGINFWPASRRFCDRDRACTIVAGLSRDALVYGVFVDMPRDGIEEVVRDVGLSGVQLHGSEPASEADGWDVPVIRAVAATSRERVATALGIAAMRDLVSGELPDTLRTRFPGYRVLVDSPAGGGSGQTIDGALLEGIDFGNAIVAGGLTPQNVAASVARLRPFGVDTAGGVESAPGIKDARSIDAFIRAARSG